MTITPYVKPVLGGIILSHMELAGLFNSPFDFRVCICAFLPFFFSFFFLLFFYFLADFFGFLLSYKLSFTSSK
jgi:hypothetical protein